MDNINPNINSSFYNQTLDLNKAKKLNCISPRGLSAFPIEKEYKCFISFPNEEQEKKRFGVSKMFQTSLTPRENNLNTFEKENTQRKENKRPVLTIKPNQMGSFSNKLFNNELIQDNFSKNKILKFFNEFNPNQIKQETYVINSNQGLKNEEIKGCRKENANSNSSKSKEIDSIKSMKTSGILNILKKNSEELSQEVKHIKIKYEDKCSVKNHFNLRLRNMLIVSSIGIIQNPNNSDLNYIACNILS